MSSRVVYETEKGEKRNIQREERSACGRFGRRQSAIWLSLAAAAAAVCVCV